jgi:hypothetical protein
MMIILTGVDFLLVLIIASFWAAGVGIDTAAGAAQPPPNRCVAVRLCYNQHTQAIGQQGARVQKSNDPKMNPSKPATPSAAPSAGKAPAPAAPSAGKAPAPAAPSAGKAPASAGKGGGKTPPAAASSRLDPDRYRVKDEDIDKLFNIIPSWADEVAAIVLLVFGVMSFLSLFNVSSDASLAASWSTALFSLFGYGSYLVAGAIFMFGVVLLLPRIGITIDFSTRRILALEVAFLAFLALLHLFGGDSEARALARVGSGGGVFGWAMSYVVAWALGHGLAVVIYSVLLAVSLVVVIGVSRARVSTLFASVSAWLRAAVEPRRQALAAKRAARQAALDAILAQEAAAAMPTPRLVPLMRIRPAPNSLPPSLRPTGAAATAVPLAQLPLDEDTAPTAPINPSASLDEFNTFKTNINSTIGSLLKKDKNAPQMVQRPDGRVKRYYSVEAMKEAKRVGKREMPLPPLELLQDVALHLPEESEINRNVVLIENTLLEFDIDVDVVDVKVGPTVTQYAVQPFREGQGEGGETTMSRTRVSKIASLSSDLTLALSAKRLRIEAPVPGHTYVGIEVPNKKPSIVALRSVYESKQFYEEAHKAKSPLVVPLGRDVAGAPITIDLATMPHLLIAGTTGSGKSMAIAAMITALLLNNTPDRTKLVLLDPKMVELSRFNGLPHLVGEVETDVERIIGVLRWCTREMDRRYKILEENSARNIEIYNGNISPRRKQDMLPYIVIFIDEVGDLMMQKPEETEKTITRLAQMARAVGMHLVVATQRPSVDVITGLIKANFPSRISFAVASGVDSRVILDSVGAENLLGRGDMLYLSNDAAGPRRLQGCYVSDAEVRAVAGHWRKWNVLQISSGMAEKQSSAPWDRALTRREVLAETDPMLEEAIKLVVDSQEASASLIQRRLGLGYPRAARMMDLLAELGIIGEPTEGGRARRVLIAQGKDPFQDVLDRKVGKDGKGK